MKDKTRGSLHSRADERPATPGPGLALDFNISKTRSPRVRLRLRELRLAWTTKDGPGGRTRTRTERGLSSLPLRWATPGKLEKWSSRQEFRLQPPRSKRGALYVELQERVKNGCLGWIRTINLPIQRRALCKLSYKAN